MCRTYSVDPVSHYIVDRVDQDGHFNTLTIQKSIHSPVHAILLRMGTCARRRRRIAVIITITLLFAVGAELHLVWVAMICSVGIRIYIFQLNSKRNRQAFANRTYTRTNRPPLSPSAALGKLTTPADTASPQQLETQQQIDQTKRNLQPTTADTLNDIFQRRRK